MSTFTRPSLRLTALALAGLAFGSAAFAGPYGNSSTVQARVLSATPVMAQVAVPRQVCFDELQQVGPRSSGAGALMGAIAGGAVGNSVGGGAGKALATGLGIFGGAVLGDRIETEGRPAQVQTVRRCAQQASYENRVVAYNVVYEYGGQQYSTQTAQNPGNSIALQVNVSPAGQGAPAYYGEPNYNAAPVYMSPAPISSVRYEPAIVPQIVLQSGWGWGGGGHHRHWD